MIDLTLRDATQQALLAPLRTTEELLARAVSWVHGRECPAEIVLLPDLGLPHNVLRARGGFFTGAFYSWESSIPFVPVDATVNIDTVSIYKIRPFGEKKDFERAVAEARQTVQLGHGKSLASSYTWNFDVGNHFITVGHTQGRLLGAGQYLVLHGSASEFKHQHNGLYPVEGNWFWNDLKQLHHRNGVRYLRYLSGKPAEQFQRLAEDLVAYNQRRHRYFADLIAGTDGVLEEVLSMAHYGMPNQQSVAIGCQWVAPGALMPLLTGPKRPILILRADQPIHNMTRTLPNFSLHPHGLGKQSRLPLELRWTSEGIAVNGREYLPGSSLEHDPSLELRDYYAQRSSDQTPAAICQILEKCPAQVEDWLDPLYSHDRYSRVVE
jgi:hypothetical protein